MKTSRNRGEKVPRNLFDFMAFLEFPREENFFAFYNFILNDDIFLCFPPPVFVFAEARLKQKTIA